VAVLPNDDKTKVEYPSCQLRIKHDFVEDAAAASNPPTVELVNPPDIIISSRNISVLLWGLIASVTPT
jgi:hypothetical protein